MRRIGAALVVFACAVASATGEASADSSTVPAGLRDVAIEQKLGQEVPLDLTFRDESGKSVRLGDLLGAKPIVLTLAYYHCPMLCPLALGGLVRSLRPLSFDVGREFDMITVSIDSRETPEQAAERKRALVADYRRPGAAAGWHFLVGDAENVRRLADAVGFRFRYDAENDQFAHATALFVLTKAARVSKVVYGVDYAPRDVRLALVEASEGKIGTIADALMLFCYHYDPATGKYGPAAMAAVRVAGALTVLGIAAFVVLSIRHEGSRA